MFSESFKMSSRTSRDRKRIRARSGSASSERSDTSPLSSDDQGSNSDVGHENELVENAYAEAGFAWCEPGVLPDGLEPEADVDIVCVAAVGAHPINTWRAKPKYAQERRILADKASTGPDDVQRALLMSGILSTVFTKAFVPLAERKFEPPWVLLNIREKIPGARVLLYNHGRPQEGDTIDSLALRMLSHLLTRRKNTPEARPIMFICHSTGGLVVKRSLVLAQQGGPFVSIGNACYGITFFSWYRLSYNALQLIHTLATPHQGSSYLSSPDFTQSICKAMRLIWPLPRSVQQQLTVKSSFLQHLTSSFMSVASELKIWTFYETVDTNLTDPKSRASDSISFLAPITSIRSAILDLHHEVDRALSSDHVDCPSFGGSENLYAKASFLDKLSAACIHACTLAKLPHKDLNLENIIEVEVHGFYEYGSTAPELDALQHRQPIRIYSTRSPLSTFLKQGPRKCLDDRLQEKDTPSTSHRMLNRLTSRQTSFRHDTTLIGPDISRSKHESSNIFASPVNEPHTMSLSSRSVANINHRARSLSISHSSPESLEQMVTDNTDNTQVRHNSTPEMSQQALRTALPKLSITADARSSQPSDPGVNTSADTTEAMPFNLIPPSPTSDASGDSRSHQASCIDSGANIQVEGDVRLLHSVQGTNELLGAASVPTPRPDSGQPKNSYRVGGIQRSLSPTPRSPEFPQPGPPERRWSSPHEVRGHPTAARLIRPDPSTQKLTWIHLAFNNPTWVKQMFERIAKDNKYCDCKAFLDDNNWIKRHIWGRHTEHHACFVKPGCTLFPSATKAKSPALSAASPKIQMSLFLPYLHWDTYKRMVRRRDVVKERIAQGRSRPIPPTVARSDLEHKVSWKYLSHDPPFNTRRTLDQFRYPHLLDTRARDDDQMLYKMTKVHHRHDDRASAAIDTLTDGDDEDSSDENPSLVVDDDEKEYENLRDGKVLMVDQVWLWAMDSPENSTLTTFFPQRETISIEGKLYQQADLRNSVYNEVNADLSRRCESSLDLAGLVALHAVTLLFERSSHHDLEVFRIFEESLSTLAEKMTKSYKFFRAKGFRATEDDGEDSEEEAHSIRERHKREGRKFQAQIRDNVSALLELRDIADELQTLQKLFTEQEKAVRDMQEVLVSNGRKETNGHTFLIEALSRLEDYGWTISQMMDSAERTKKEFEKLLDLVQRQANVDEARLSRWQADLQSSQSRAIMIFTVFTIIFLPLTFFTGFFGMNTSEWAGMDSMVSIFTIAEAAIPLSVFIIASALCLALSTRLRRWTIFLARFLISPLEDLNAENTMHGSVPFPHTKTSPRPKARKLRFRRPKQTRTMHDYDEGDFWEDQREKLHEPPYEIPAQNRRRAPPVPKSRKRKTTSSFGSFLGWTRGPGHGQRDSNA